MGGTSRKNKSSSRDHNGRSSSSNRNQRVPRDPSDQEKTPLVGKHTRENELHRAKNGDRQQRHANGHHRSKKQGQLGSFIGDNQKRRNEESNNEHVRLLDPIDSESVEFSLLTAPSAFMEDIDLQRPTNEEQNGNNTYKYRNGRNGRGIGPRVDEYDDKNNDNSNNRRRRWFSKVKVNNLNSDGSTGGNSNASSISSTARMRNGVNNSSNGINNSKYTSGVKYRSATSTQRALDELKRKQMEAQEKKRALTILCLLAVVAFAVHFTNSNHSGADGIGAFYGKAIRGSKDKEYGEVKDLGYGGERVPSSSEQQQLVPASQEKPSDGQGAGNNGGSGEDADYYNTEYELPPPVEKDYDEEHKFLEPLRHFADVKDPHRPTDTALFFHVPRAGGSTMKDIIGKCLKLVQSSEVGVRDGHDKDPTLEVLDVKESKYVNVDTTTVPGIQRAVDMGLAAAGVTEVIVSSYYHESAALFDLNHQGRAFMMMRNPIDRAVSMYWHRVKEIGDLDAEVSIEDYAQGNGIENNWMTRFMTNRMTGELTKEDMEQAKQILKEKFLIGLLDDLDETVYRIMKYNEWKFSTDETEKMKQEDCIRDLTTVGSAINPDPYEIPTRGTQAYALITWQTQFDTKLFEYAKQLFDEQTKQWGTKERKKLLKKQKKKGN
mmetsp:Transcript_6485/g.10147  ORF Transcript_6485/g.10147 Transcript_6485/m.10147 type:complete len:660 (+) Transcript_6485:44-2023(+)